MRKAWRRPVRKAWWWSTGVARRRPHPCTGWTHWRHAWWSHHVARWSHHVRSPLAATFVVPVLGKVDANLGGAQPLSSELDSPINRCGVCILHMAKHSATALATVETHLLDITALSEEIHNHLLSRVARKTANPYSPTALWLDSLRTTSSTAVPVLANAVRCNGLVLSKIQANGYSFDRGACKLHSLVHGLCLDEFHVSKLPVPQLVDSQGYHLDLSTTLKEVNQVLLRGVNRDVANP